MAITTKNIVYTSLGIAALGGVTLGGIALYNLYRVNSGGKLSDSGVDKPDQNYNDTPDPVQGWRHGVFPLKQGMFNNNNVYFMQQALIGHGGEPENIIRETGLDGDFGSGTKRALQAAGYPAEVSKEKYEEILEKGNVQPVPGWLDDLFPVEGADDVKGSVKDVKAKYNTSIRYANGCIKNVDAGKILGAVVSINENNNTIGVLTLGNNLASVPSHAVEIV